MMVFVWFDCDRCYFVAKILSLEELKDLSG